MKANHELDAFTLTEILVALLISMLVITCMLNLYSYVSAYTKTFQKQYSINQQVINTVYFLKQNSLKSQQMYLENNSSELCFQKKVQDACFFSGDTSILLYPQGMDTVFFRSAITNPRYKDSVLYQVDILFKTGSIHYSTSLGKEYNRDYLINQLQRHEYIIK